MKFWRGALLSKKMIQYVFVFCEECGTLCTVPYPNGKNLLATNKSQYCTLDTTMFTIHFFVPIQRKRLSYLSREGCSEVNEKFLAT